MFFVCFVGHLIGRLGSVISVSSVSNALDSHQPPLALAVFSDQPDHALHELRRRLAAGQACPLHLEKSLGHQRALVWRVIDRDGQDERDRFGNQQRA